MPLGRQGPGEEGEVSEWLMFGLVMSGLIVGIALMMIDDPNWRPPTHRD